MLRLGTLFGASALLATACGLPFGGASLPSTSQLINGAADSFVKASGLEVSGNFTQGTDTYSLDMQITPPTTAHITMTQNNLQIEAIQVGGRVFYHGKDFVASVEGPSDSGQAIAKAVGDRWFTSKDATPVDVSAFTDASKIKANFFNTLTVKRKDNVSVQHVNTAELSAESYILNITEASPFRLVELRSAAGKTVADLSNADLAFSNYDKDFAIQPPTNVFDVDDRSTWPPLYERVSISNAKCDDPCVMSAVYQNNGGPTGASAPSVITFTISRKADGSVLGSCKVTIQPDVANNGRVTASCSITSAAWTSFTGTYLYDSSVDNPAYD
jgi:hypothetical protein